MPCSLTQESEHESVHESAHLTQESEQHLMAERLYAILK